ncbi:unnamed protein product [marine sediment metagenome]|uniref:Uncharacterized protein n=1 Tax=marine sediment metagenome TaxID=412755 RepID=X0VEZ1_9ZZZZ
MAIVTLTADGDAVIILAAAQPKALIQNNSHHACVIENAADPAAGLVLAPKEIINLPASWIQAWTGKALNGVAVQLRVIADVAAP